LEFYFPPVTIHSWMGVINGTHPICATHVRLVSSFLCWPSNLCYTRPSRVLFSLLVSLSSSLLKMILIFFCKLVVKRLFYRSTHCDFHINQRCFISHLNLNSIANIPLHNSIIHVFTSSVFSFYSKSY
jgi:hypothetical protein